MQIVHRHTDIEQPAKTKRVPLYKDEEAIRAMVKQIIRENDERLMQKLKKQKSPATNRA